MIALSLGITARKLQSVALKSTMRDMLSKRLFRFIHHIALFAIIFASVAPSISHALAAQNNSNSFTQEVCTSSGEKVVIQVLTTKGKQLATEFVVSKSSPKTMAMHLEHCPFCSNAAVTASLPATNTFIIAVLAATAQQIAQYAAPTVVSRPYVSPPSQAPPSTL
ncbi:MULTISPECIES: DUF2946 domain-containing protein [Methylotenera]|uniref:DUF2946 domain-containing protein n=1 Tax=Methylotenera TaxID=359407 RepID=UPI00036D1F4A|nr:MULTISPECIES: DUF2946 domain-containing protein [Methylotenera]